MSTSKILTIQKAAKNVSQTIYFSKRWCRVQSLAKAISTRYELENIVINAKTISSAIGKMEPSINETCQVHSSGIYRGYKSGKAFYYFQSTSLPPPYLPHANEKTLWNSIEKEDTQKLQ